MPIERISPYEARTLASFFRGGDVYYRPSIVTSFRFDLRLPTKMRTAMTRLQVPIAGITARAGQSYNAFAEVGLTPEEERDLAEAADPDDVDTTTGGGRVSLRSYGVQTCYGWWVPSAYHGKLEEKLGPARAKRSALLNRLAQLLTTGGDALRAQGAARFLQLEEFAKRRTSDSRNRHQNDLNDSTRSRRARKRLADPRWRQRAEKPYVRAPVPEIWSDPTSSQEFIDSFFDYLEFVASTRKRPAVWRSLTEQIASLDGSASSDDIRHALSEHLRREGWREGDWWGRLRTTNRCRYRSAR